MKSRLISSIRIYSGIQAFLERRIQGAAIVAYHGLIDKIKFPNLELFCTDIETFEKHLKFYRSNYQPISLSTLIDAISKGKSIDSRWLVLTFDDALKSQVTIGSEMLDYFEIPWSLSVPTGLIGTDRSLWTYEISFLILHCWRKPAIKFPDYNRTLLTETNAQRLSALSELRKLLFNQVSHKRRLKIINQLIDEYGCKEFLERLKKYKIFTIANWEDIKKVHDKGVEILSHGHCHWPLNNSLTDDELAEEIVFSQKALYKHLGQEPNGFCIPFGIYTGKLIHIIERSGYNFCLTYDTGRITNNSSLFYLPRINAEYPLSILRRNLLTSA